MHNRSEIQDGSIKIELSPASTVPTLAASIRVVPGSVTASRGMKTRLISTPRTADPSTSLGLENSIFRPDALGLDNLVFPNAPGFDDSVFPDALGFDDSVFPDALGFNDSVDCRTSRSGSACSSTKITNS